MFTSRLAIPRHEGYGPRLVMAWLLILGAIPSGLLCEWALLDPFLHRCVVSFVLLT
jgi:hypothetical protein